MKVWITKYALTSGIQVADAEDCGKGLIRVRDDRGYHAYYHVEGRDWHKTASGAFARAIEMREKRIVSLKKSIAKLQCMTFDVPGIDP